MNYVSLSNSLFLVQHEIPANKPSKPVPTNHIWLIDRSGSMEGEIRGLITDLKKLVGTLRLGDTVTLGWFSGKGQRNFIVKGFKVAADADYATLDKLLDRHASTVGMTFFSEILGDVAQVVEDLKVFSDVFSLIFLSDGYPTEGGSREIETTLETVSSLRSAVTTALLVGFGNYYNKVLLAGMAERLGASLIHADDLQSFMTTTGSFLTGAAGAGRKVRLEIDLPYAPGTTRYLSAFSVGQTVSLLSQDPGQVVYLAEGSSRAYILSSVKPVGREVTDLGESWLQGIYGAAYVLTQMAKTDCAIEALGVIGDVYLIDELTNAFTPSEYGRAERRILEAILGVACRFKRGKKTNYVPPADAYCLLDLLDELGADDQARFYPYNDGFKYQRIGVKAEAADPNAPKFYADPEAGLPVDSLVWNSSMLNLSVRGRIPGKIKLVGNAKKHGFSSDYPTWVHRTYTLVRDGFFNVKALPMSMSEATFTSLHDRGLIDAGDSYLDENTVHLVHLDRIPVINRKLAEGRTSAKDLAASVEKEYRLKGMLKALKWYAQQERGDKDDKTGVFSSFTQDQVQFLESNHITKNGYAPKTEKADPTDFYMAKSFEIKVKGLSSFPKVADVEKKLTSGKPLTKSENFVYAGIQHYEKSGMSRQPPVVRLAWLDAEVARLQKEQRAVSRAIQETKFAVLLAKVWFEDFPSRDDCVLDQNGLNMTFAVEEVRIDI